MNKLFKPQQMKVLLISHVKEIIREPGVLFWGIVFPLLMTLGLGIAFTQSSEIIRTVAVSNEGDSLKNFFKTKASPAEEGYKLKIKDDKRGSSTYIFKLTTWEEAIILLKRGEVNLILTEQNGNIKYNFDPVNPEGELTYLNLSRILSEKNNSGNEEIKPLNLEGTRYIDFLVPGMLAMGIMMSSSWGIGYGLIEKRNKKLLRRMIATPMKKSHFMISFMAVRTFMNLIEAVLLFIFSYLVFGVTMQGSINAFILIFIASNIAFSGLAIVTASRTSSMEVGNGIISAVTTPMIVLSGIFFSYNNFPEWAQSFIKLLPLTILADGMRSIFIEGAGLNEILFPFLVLLITGIILFWAGLKYFKWH